jgi:hypothetical protein
MTIRYITQCAVGGAPLLHCVFGSRVLHRPAARLFASSLAATTCARRADPESGSGGSFAIHGDFPEQVGTWHILVSLPPSVWISRPLVRVWIAT